jgi:hypothetical protein
METFEIKYNFKFPQKGVREHSLVFDSESIDLLNKPREESRDFTKLDFHQCPNCTLDIESHPHCPLALKLVDMLRLCEDVQSFDNVRVEVVTPKRTILKDTTAQRGFSSLMGLIIPPSGCPHTAFLKPLTRFHLPFADEEETIYRIPSMYMLLQYFRRKEGESTDYTLEGLKSKYKELHIVNTAFAERLRASISRDVSVNALSLLDVFADTVRFEIEHSLEDVRYLFEPLL